MFVLLVKRTMRACTATFPVEQLVQEASVTEVSTATAVAYFASPTHMVLAVRASVAASSARVTIEQSTPEACVGPAPVSWDLPEISAVVASPDDLGSSANTSAHVFMGHATLECLAMGDAAVRLDGLVVIAISRNGVKPLH